MTEVETIKGEPKIVVVDIHRLRIVRLSDPSNERIAETFDVWLDGQKLKNIQSIVLKMEACQLPVVTIKHILLPGAKP